MSSLIVEVCKVDDIRKHENADRLSVVSVRGWNSIVGLDQYKVGDLVVFVPPDSIIPPELIEKHKLEYLRTNGRVGTTRLRGVLSQGLILDLPEGKWKEGDDCSKVLGITKWQPPEAPIMKGAKQTSKKKLNPNLSIYTDIENIKNYNNIFQPEDLVVITEKIHGCNARYGNLEIEINKSQPFLYRVKSWFKKYILGQTHEFVYGSHKVQITANNSRKSFYSEDVWGKMGQKYDMKNIVPKDYIVYGEIYGKGIQDLTYGLEGIDLVIFDVKYKDKYLDWNAFVDFCKEKNLRHVPVLYVGSYLIKGTVDICTTGKSVLYPKQIREGCVVKMVEEQNDPKIGRKVLKSINPDYLLRKNGTEFQ